MRIERISTYQELCALERDWNMLVRRSSVNSVFLTWEWLASWWLAYGRGKELFVLVARSDAGECLGIAPLQLEKSGRTWLLRFLGDGTYDSDYLDFVVLPAHQESVLAAFYAHLIKNGDKWDAMQLNEIPENSSSLGFLRGLVTTEGWLVREEQVPCGVRSLPPTWDEFLRTLKPRFRTSARACLRNLEEWEGAYEVLTNETDLSSWLCTLYDLHSDRWALRQQSGVFAKQSKRDFYDRMARALLQRGWLHLSRWRLKDAVLASQFGMVYDGTYYLLQEGFDSRCIHVSPGVTLRAATIRDLISRGVRTYDFLGGMGRHKSDWGANGKSSVRMALAPRTVAGRIYVTLPETSQSVRNAFKRWLPDRLLISLKQVRAGSAKLRRVTRASDLTSSKRSFVKEILATALLRTGVLRLVRSFSRRYEEYSGSPFLPTSWRKVQTSKFVILCYHRIGSGGVPLYSSLEPEIFETQMKFLRNRYRIVPFDTLAKELEGSGPPEHSVVITFDDGYRDVYRHAFPILRKYEIPATIYLTSNAIESNSVAWYDRIFLALNIVPGDKLDLLLDRPRRFSLPTSEARLRAAEEIISYLRTLPSTRCEEFCLGLENQIPLPPEELANRMLTWEQIREMQQAGIAFGSHTLSHATVSRLEPAALERELSQSKAFLEQRLGVPVKDFAYPFGKFADYENSISAVERSGYRTAATTNWGINVPGVNPYELKRVSIGEERQLSMFALKLAQLFLSAELTQKLHSSASSRKEAAVCSST